MNWLNSYHENKPSIPMGIYDAQKNIIHAIESHLCMNQINKLRK